MARCFEQPVKISNGYLHFDGAPGAPSTGKTGDGYLIWDPATTKFYLMRDGAARVELYDSTQQATATTAALAANVAVSANIDPGLIQQVKVTIASADVLTLFSTPYQLVAAPGAGKIIQFIGCTLSYVYATTGYTIGSSTNLAVKYTDGSGASVSTTRAATGFVDQTANKYEVMGALATAVTPVLNAALVLTLAGANLTGGDGSLTAQVTYRVLSVP